MVAVTNVTSGAVAQSLLLRQWSFLEDLNMIFVLAKKNEKHHCKKKIIWKWSLAPREIWFGMVLPYDSCWLCNFDHVAGHVIKTLKKIKILKTGKKN